MIIQNFPSVLLLQFLAGVNLVDMFDIAYYSKYALIICIESRIPSSFLRLCYFAQIFFPVTELQKDKLCDSLGLI